MKDLRHSYQNSIVINGSARSGTTWLWEIFCTIKNSLPLYEPTDSRYEEAKKLQCWYRYLNPERNYPEIKNYFKMILTGQVRKIKRSYESGSRLCNEYLLLRERISQFKFCLHRLPVIKFVRGHFFLNYLQVNFSPKIITILRHPCAALESALRVGLIDPGFETMLGDRNKELFKNYPDLMEKCRKSLELLKFKESYFNGQTSKIRIGKRYIIKWCISNCFMINEIKRNRLKATVTFYENLFQNPTFEINKICKFWDIEYDKRMTSRINIASVSAHKDSPLKKKENITVLNQWKKSLEPELQDFTFTILDLFDLDIYNHHEHPNKNSKFVEYISKSVLNK